MRFKKVRAVYFSPTGTTKKAALHLAAFLAKRLSVPYEAASYTLPGERERGFDFSKDELIVWATPVYAGRIPNRTLEYVKTAIKGRGAYVVALAVYGNRSFGDTLSEMCAVIKDGGCMPIAAIAAPARHAFSDTLAAGRPDEADMEALERFAGMIALRLESGGDTVPAAVPGEERPKSYYTPLKEDGGPARFLKAVPKVREDMCTRCGVCENVCPEGSVSMDEYPAFRGVCIKCMACVRACPRGALYFDDAELLSHIRMIEKNFSELKEAKLFI